MDGPKRNGETDEKECGSLTSGTLMQRLSLEERTETDGEGSFSSSASEDDSDETCSVCYDKLQYPIKLPCNHLFCFLCIKGAHASNHQCPMCRARIPSTFILEPELLSKSTRTKSSKSAQSSKRANLNEGKRVTRSSRKMAKKIDDEIFWCYESKRQYKTWWKYDKRTTAEIEAAFQLFKNSPKSAPNYVDLQITGKIYRIDFVSSEQYLSNGLGRRRLIQRSSEMVDGSDTIIGTAGIKQLK